MYLLNEKRKGCFYNTSILIKEHNSDKCIKAINTIAIESLTYIYVDK